MTERGCALAWPAPVVRPALLIATLLAGGGALGQVATPGSGERARTAFGDSAAAAEAGRPDAALERVGRAAADRLGLDFLGAASVEHEGRRLASVRVMEPAGNSNAAFLVQTLVVDPANGEVLGVFPGVNARSSGFPPGFAAPVTEPGGPPRGDAGGG
jgi:hypothetical protein